MSAGVIRPRFKSIFSNCVGSTSSRAKFINLKNSRGLYV